MTDCARCNKPLTDPLSVLRGFGPECIKLVEADRAAQKEHMGGELGAFRDEVVLQLSPKGDFLSNIVHRKIAHSPTGFAWGYEGSGPADLALNILLYFVPEPVAWNLHQLFKRDFIARVPEQGGRIPRAAIQEWINARIGALPFESEAEVG